MNKPTKNADVSSPIKCVVSAAERHFIIFYKAQNQTSYQYGQKYIKGTVLPNWRFIQEEIAKAITYKYSDVNIIGFNEVSFEDCASYFDSK